LRLHLEVAFSRFLEGRSSSSGQEDTPQRQRSQEPVGDRRDFSGKRNKYIKSKRRGKRWGGGKRRLRFQESGNQKRRTLPPLGKRTRTFVRLRKNGRGRKSPAVCLGTGSRNGWKDSSIKNRVIRFRHANDLKPFPRGGGLRKGNEKKRGNFLQDNVVWYNWGGKKKRGMGKDLGKINLPIWTTADKRSSEWDVSYRRNVRPAPPRGPCNHSFNVYGKWQRASTHYGLGRIQKLVRAAGRGCAKSL